MDIIDENNCVNSENRKEIRCARIKLRRNATDTRIEDLTESSDEMPISSNAKCEIASLNSKNKYHSH